MKYLNTIHVNQDENMEYLFLTTEKQNQISLIHVGIFGFNFDINFSIS